MNMTEKQNALFSEWKKKEPGLVTDGVIDELQYLKAPVRICFLLKEVNGGADWDLCDFVRKGGRAQTWNNISRWVYGIYHSGRDIPWSDLQDIDNVFRQDYLQSICAVNVKKRSGKSEADNGLVYRAGERYREQLRKQLEIYEPQVLICCGTADSYFDFITEFEDPQWEMTSRGIWYVREPAGRLVISYAHPEARVRDNLLYYGLIDAYREIIYGKRLHGIREQVP